METSIIKASHLWKTDDGFIQKPQKHRIKTDLNAKRWNDLYNVTIQFFILLQFLLMHTTTIQAVPADSRNIVDVAANAENYSTINALQTLQRTLRDVATKTVSFNSGREPSNNNNHQKNISTDTTEIGIRSGGESSGMVDVSGSSAIVQNPSTTEITFDQPQGQCLLDGEYVPETTVFCEKQVGCRAIQKTGHCCPDYKCDCQKDGKTYANGDKLVDPETPCTVCYCQGGEILCSSVTCFHRDDCTPKYIPGVCCPEYDNCPVSIVSETAINATFSAATTTTTIKPNISNESFNQKITIKEITKPIEIRITDDNRAIPIPQMILKPAFNANATHEAVTAASSSASLSSTAEAAAATTATITTINKITPVTMSTAMPPSTSTQRGPTLTSSMTNPTFSTNTNKTKPIKEATNETSIKLTALSIDNNQNHKANAYTGHNVKSTNNGKIGENGYSGESLKLSASVAYTTNIMDTNNSSIDKNASISMFDDMITENGKMNNDYMEDQALTLSSSLSSSSESSLSVFNNHLSSHDPNKVNIKREYLGNPDDNTIKNDKNKNHSDANIVLPTILINDEENENITTIKTQMHSYTDSIMDSEFDTIDSDTAGSDNIYHIVLTTEPTSHLTNLMEISSFTNLLQHSTNDDTNLQDGNNISIQETINQQSQQSQQTQYQYQYHHHQNHSDDDEGSLILIESNPAYPSLPEDDFSLRDINFQLHESDDTSDEALSTSLSSLAATQNNSDSDKSTKTMVTSDHHNDDHHYDGGSGIIMDDLITISSTTTTTTTTAAAAVEATTANTQTLIGTDEINKQQKNLVTKENHKLSTKITTTMPTQKITTAKALAEFINSAEDSSSEETIISNIDITNINQLNKRNYTIKMPPLFPSSVDTKEMHISLENGSGEGHNDNGDDIIAINKNDKNEHQKSTKLKSIQLNAETFDADETVAIASASGDGNSNL